MSLVSPVLVGRRAESSVLSSAIAATRRGQGSAVFVVGEPGIGKSRLVTDATAAATRAGARLLRGRAASGGCAVPFRPLAEAVFSALRSEGAPASREFGPYWPALSRLGRLEPAAAGADESLVVLAEAVLRLLSVLGEQGGCVLLLEDLHDADADTLGVVDYLVDNVTSQPVLLLATLRPDAGPALELAETAAARRAATLMRLRRLVPAEVSELTARCLGTPAERVPPAALSQLHRFADGTPFVVEELLGAMIESGSLVRHDGGWAVDGTLHTGVPATVAAAVLQRVERLDADCVAMLEAAAVLGHRFPVRVAARVAGVDPEAAFRQLRPAARSQLIVADPDGDPAWQSFRHALTVDAILGRLLPGERVALSRIAAEEIEADRAGLGDDRFQHAAELWAIGGEPDRAAALLTRAGQLAAGRSALITAVELFDRGLALLDAMTGAPAPPGTVADLLESLLQTLLQTGDTARVFALGERLDGALLAAGAPTARRVAARLIRARAAAAVGHWEAGLAEVAAARELAGPDPGPELTAPTDAAAAQLVLGSARHDRAQAAAELAQRAVAAAESVPLPAVACEALDVLGRGIRVHDPAAAQAYFERSVAIAETHGLTIWRIRALLELGVIDKLRTGGIERLVQARDAAEEAGAVITVTWLELHLATVHIYAGAYDLATRCGERAAALARKLRLHELELLANGVHAGVAAGRGRRTEMEAALAGLGRVLGYGTEVWGWARGTCALMEEDPDRAMAEFRAAAAADEAVPNIRPSGYRGIYLLLSAVRGEAGWADLDEFAGSWISRVQLHRPFVGWTRAVLLGREGRAEEAEKAAAEAIAEASTMPVAAYYARRLVAEQALAQGWGEPVEWLRTAEEYFHAEQITRVAAACRAMLRQAGVQVTQRRRGHQRIPDAVRRAGVTVREYEVLRLLADRLGDREIAEELFLSPRTVEKHVASLRARTDQPDRAALIAYARQHVPRG